MVALVVRSAARLTHRDLPRLREQRFPQPPAATILAAAPTVWEPLRQNLFRSLWLAAIVSNLGSFLQDVGAAWMMTSVAASPILVALLQTAETLPMMLLALPAGALADRLDRRRVLLTTQTWMLAVAAGLGLLTLCGAAGPWGLLGFNFLLGLGGALNSPAWQSIMPELVGREHLPAALALNSVGFNLARALGPALGGLLVAAAGPSAVFLLNAASYVGVVLVLYRWRRQPKVERKPQAGMGAAVAEGLRFVRRDGGMRAVLARCAAFVLCGSGLWALLPIFARRELHSGASGYGILLGCLGLGAVIGAMLLPRCRQLLSIDRLVLIASALFAAVLLALAAVTDFAAACGLLIVGGAAWITVMANLSLAAQTAVPNWVRSRGLSVYLLVSQGGMAAGGAVWGALATRAGTSAALSVSAAGLLMGLAVARWQRLPESQVA